METSSLTFNSLIEWIQDNLGVEYSGYNEGDASDFIYENFPSEFFDKLVEYACNHTN